MNPPGRFLTSLGQAVSVMSLYQEGHPAWERALDQAYDHLLELLETDDNPVFSFLGNEIVYKDRLLHDLRGWDWGGRLSAVGVERLELVDPVSRDELEGFMTDVLGRITEGKVSTAEARQMRETNVRYGRLKIKEREEARPGHIEKQVDVAVGFDLKDEVETVTWLLDEIRERDTLHLAEVETIVRSLSVVMHGDQEFLIPLLMLKHFDQYTTTHALNVSVLAMALAEFIGLEPGEVKAFGIAGLLHDLGKTRIPEEILNKPGRLTYNEREIMNGHPVEGARIILETEEELDLAAVVAYEHHIRLDGGGYPTFAIPRPCHQASNMVHVCDVFDALRTKRPYRDAWGRDRVLDYIEQGAGTEFQPELARNFVQMIHKWSDRLALLRSEDEELPLTGGDSEEVQDEGGVEAAAAAARAAARSVEDAETAESGESDEA